MLHVDPTLAALDAVPAAPPPPDQPGMARILVERQLALLTRLADRGMEIAERAADRALAALEGEKPEEGADRRDPSLVYEGAARAIRMTIALQARLLKELPDLDKAESLARIDQRHGRKRRILRAVEQVIAADAEDDGYEIKRLSGEAWSRLRDADDYSDILTCPFDEAVARICTQLGLEPEAWATEITDDDQDDSLPFMGRVAPKGPGGARGEAEPVPPPDPLRGPPSPQGGGNPDAFP